MYSFDSKIRYSETDCNGLLCPDALIDYFQDCSTFQSEELGVGLKYLADRDLVWVLAAWQVEVDRYPALCEKVKVGTIPYEINGFLGLRNFFMEDKEGRMIARANSIWTLLNTKTQRPAMVPQEVLDKYCVEQRISMEYPPRKIAVPEGGEMRPAIEVEAHHLDTNHHVNNGQFIRFALSFLPESYPVGRIRAEYKKQAFLQDKLIPYVVSTQDSIYVRFESEAGQVYMSAQFGKGNEKND